MLNDGLAWSCSLETSWPCVRADLDLVRSPLAPRRLRVALLRLCGRVSGPPVDVFAAPVLVGVDTM